MAHRFRDALARSNPETDDVTVHHPFGNYLSVHDSNVLIWTRRNAAKSIDCSLTRRLPIHQTTSPHISAYLRLFQHRDWRLYLRQSNAELTSRFVVDEAVLCKGRAFLLGLNLARQSMRKSNRRLAWGDSRSGDASTRD
jgi:hypothetical protein